MKKNVASLVIINIDVFAKCTHPHWIVHSVHAWPLFVLFTATLNDCRFICRREWDSSLFGFINEMNGLAPSVLNGKRAHRKEEEGRQRRGGKKKRNWYSDRVESAGVYSSGSVFRCLLPYAFRFRSFRFLFSSSFNGVFLSSAHPLLDSWTHGNESRPTSRQPEESRNVMKNFFSLSFPFLFSIFFFRTLPILLFFSFVR